MKKVYNSTQICAVEKTVKQFKHWRKTTVKGQRRMSLELRNMAIDLSQQIGIFPASKELGLNCTDLKKWREKTEERKEGSFTEIMVLPSPSFSCRLEIKKNDTCINVFLGHDSNVDQTIALINGVL